MNRPVLFAVHQSERSADGGVESATQILERMRTPRIVLTQRESRFADRWRAAGCQVAVVEAPTTEASMPPWRERLRRSPFLAKHSVCAAQLIREHGVRVVHCNDIAAFWRTAPAARAMGAKVLFNVRSIFASGRPYGVKWRATRNLASEVVCLSREMAETFERRCPPLSALAAATVDYTYSAIDLERMRPPTVEVRQSLRQELGLHDDDVHVVLVGVVHAIKNQLDLIRYALPILRARMPKLRLTLVGDFNPDHEEYAKACLVEVERQGAQGQVRFAGYSAAPERYYQAADVTCLVSVYEGLARCMAESLACGTPMAAFDLPSTREFLEEHDVGEVVAHGDYTSLALAIERLALSRHQRGISDRAAALARRSFDPKRSVEAYIERYRRLSREA